MSITNPGNQTSTVGTQVSLQIQASDTDGGTLAYSPSGLPPGLTLNSSTGLISGKPTAQGTSNVTVTATDASGPSRSTSFTWTVSPASGAKMISTGSIHTCALFSAGTIECWGSNASGQLGNGSTTDSFTPIQVSGITNAISVAAGNQQTCAALASGNVECWGDNQYGQLGNGSLRGPGPGCQADCIPSPVSVTGINTAVGVAGGGGHMCALLSSGAVKCWGHNELGQLGDGSISDSSTPVPVSGITNAKAIVSGGADVTCALLIGGNVACWGSDGSGQLGEDPATLTYPCASPCSTTPVVVNGITNATAVAVAGDEAVCAVLSAGGIDCLGATGQGALGNGSTTGASCNGGCDVSPVSVSGISNATAITAGAVHNCTVLATGSVRCWGFNRDGELGNGTMTGPDQCFGGAGAVCSATPVDVTGLTGVSALSGGGGGLHTCALLTAGSVECWGFNNYGQLGNGQTGSSDTPVTVAGIG